MMHRRSLSEDQHGVAALEFAIVGPLLFIFIFAIINCGDLAWTYTTLHNGVVAAARYAAVQSNTALASSSISALDPQSCASSQSIQATFARAVSGPILKGQIPVVSVSWGGTLIACNVLTGSTFLSSLPGGYVSVAAQFNWQPLAMPNIFGSITINVNDLQSVIEAPAA